MIAAGHDQPSGWLPLTPNHMGLSWGQSLMHVNKINPPFLESNPDHGLIQAVVCE